MALPEGASSSDLERGAGALKSLKKRIDGVLEQLDKSAGGKARVSARRVPRGSFSGQNVAFSEADDLFRKYNEVHATLTALSQALSAQIDGVGLAVKAADRGYDALEADEQRRYATLQRRTEELMRRVKDKGKSEGKTDSDDRVDY
ncbi:hypothetical protein [Streptomyces boncukensis]|uniref:Uncharacterized protein n=1 Tax=Streptomyces boncukensis TaxID=2711219 RepID=A0A6G4X259_9ACTN|nr:hypothetical protein [Streptomyces boncukensis]NGO71629.1 hypothetical protein [Streptomyces boncukensis]